MRQMRTWVAVAAVAALAAIAAGCGGSSDKSSSASPTEQWASGFCTALTDWTNSLQDVTSTVASNPTQDGLKSAAEDLRSSTDTLISDLKDLGAPDTPSGDQVKSSLDSLSTTIDDEVNTIQNAAKGVSNLTQLPGAISTITESLKALGDAFSNTLTTIDNADASGELQGALKSSPDCKDITS